MFDRNDLGQLSINDISPEMNDFLNQTRETMKGCERRKFMARVVLMMGRGGQSRAEKELGWDRTTIRKGIKELNCGIDCMDNFSGRGRKRTENNLPNFLEDIRDIVNPISQADPTFRTTNIYIPITAEKVHGLLIKEKNYSMKELPTVRTIITKLNQLGFSLKKVAKCKPKKKIAETDVIFDHVHLANRLADENEGMVRLSMDAKATIKIGPFSRGGYSRQDVKACDHDFGPEITLKLFGIFIPGIDEPYFYFTDSNITADFMIDALESLWPMIQSRYDPHTIVINADNGPENNSRRSQYIKRLVDFAKMNEVNFSLAYYPPYHSKYNPIERVWGVLENHWNGELLDSVDKTLGLARSMTWKGKNPVVTFVNGVYEKGVRLCKEAMEKLEQMIERTAGIEKWAVDISY